MRALSIFQSLYPHVRLHLHLRAPSCSLWRQEWRQPSMRTSIKLQLSTLYHSFSSTRRSSVPSGTSPLPSSSSGESSAADGSACNGGADNGGADAEEPWRIIWQGFAFLSLIWVVDRHCAYLSMVRIFKLASLIPILPPHLFHPGSFGFIWAYTQCSAHLFLLFAHYVAFNRQCTGYTTICSYSLIPTHTTAASLSLRRRRKARP